jgi:hypothetical protein
MPFSYWYVPILSLFSINLGLQIESLRGLLVSFKKSLSLWLDSDRRLSNLLVSISENLVSEVFMPTMRISLLIARVSLSLTKSSIGRIKSPSKFS